MRVLPVVVGLLAGLAAVAAAGAVEVEVEVGEMRVDPATGSPVVRLVEKGRAPAARELPIWIGPFEAQAIALEMQGLPPPRPFTHDLMKAIVERLGGKLTRVVIEDLRDDTYFATVHLAAPGGRRFAVDARPSDAIALALRLHGPILVSEQLLVPAAGRTAPAAARVWGLTLQDLTPEVAAFFDIPARGGVLVSDVAASAPARTVRRGDVIVAVDGEPVASVDELAQRADRHSTTDPVRLSLRRGGREVQTSFVAE
jgi:bifunctional DNase/RNase